MQPLKFRKGPNKMITYYFNQDEYKGTKFVSIVKSIHPIDPTDPNSQKKSYALTITKNQWEAFCRWIETEVIKGDKPHANPLTFPAARGSIEFTFNRDEEYEGKRFSILHKKDTRFGKPKYQNIAVNKDQWPDFRKWLKELIKQKTNF